MKKSKRGEYTRKRRKKFRHLKNTGMLSEYYKQKRESIKQTYGKTINKKTTTQNISTMEEVKAEEIKKQTNMDKSIFKSKLFWIGVINIVIGILNYIEGSLTNGIGITLNGILIVVFRYITTEGVYFKKPQ